MSPARSMHGRKGKAVLTGCGGRKRNGVDQRSAEAASCALRVRIAASEARKAEIEKELDANASNHTLVQKLYEELQSLNEALDRDLERWTELAELA